jgi:hypothetical protein
MFINDIQELHILLFCGSYIKVFNVFFNFNYHFEVWLSLNCA